MTTNYSGQTYYAQESNLLYRVYGWMCLALALTASTAYYVSTSPSFLAMIFGQDGKGTMVPIILFIVQIGLVLALSLLIQRISYPMAVILFLLYALTLGVTLSAIFLVYTYTSIFATFLVASGMFGAMAIYGYFTKSDLSSMGSFLFMALIGLVIGGFVNMFLKSDSFQYVLAAIGVLIFTLYTAYDVQKIKNIMQDRLADRETMSKVAIIGALTLYLDFVNLFLSLLQFMGRKKE